MSRMAVTRFTGSLQKTDSMKCCSSRWRKTDTGAGASLDSTGPLPKTCSTGGRTCACIQGPTWLDTPVKRLLTK